VVAGIGRLKVTIFNLCDEGKDVIEVILAILLPGNSRHQGDGLLGKREGSPLRKTGS
jgi:hypothetical protein